MKTFFSKKGLGLSGTTLAKLFYNPGVLPYISHIGMCRPNEWLWFLGLFGLKTGKNFAHFGL